MNVNVSFSAFCFSFCSCNSGAIVPLKFFPRNRPRFDSCNQNSSLLRTISSNRSGSKTAKHISSNSLFTVHIPSFWANEHHTRKVSSATVSAFRGSKVYNVRMLCNLSAILIKNTLGSFTTSKSNSSNFLLSSISSSDLLFVLLSLLFLRCLLRTPAMTLPILAACKTSSAVAFPKFSRSSNTIFLFVSPLNKLLLFEFGSSRVATKRHALIVSRNFSWVAEPNLF